MKVIKSKLKEIPCIAHLDLRLICKEDIIIVLGTFRVKYFIDEL